MFPDSKRAEAYACARTKTAAIITHALAPAMREEVVQVCHSSAFSILCDGGNDHFDKKYFAVLVRYWDVKVNHVVTRFLAMPICNKADAENLFDALNTAMEEHEIPWNNVVGYASDTVNVMVGAHNLVVKVKIFSTPYVVLCAILTLCYVHYVFCVNWYVTLCYATLRWQCESTLNRVRDKQPHVFSLGCLCHLANLCGVAALKTLPISVDELLIDVFYHFKYSAKRWEMFSEIQAEDIQPLRVLETQHINVAQPTSLPQKIT